MRRMSSRIHPLAVVLLSSALGLASGCGGGRASVADADTSDMTFVVAPHREPPAVAWQGDGGEDDAKYGPTVLKSMRLVSIVAMNDSMGKALLDFGDGVAKSNWYATLANEYGLGAAGPSVRITGPAINDARIDETGITRYIDNALAAQDPAIVADGRTVIVLYLPGSTQFLWNGIANECDQIAKDDKTFGAYHKPYGNQGDQWSVVMHCPLPKGLSQLDQVTLFASQQIADALTNPGGQGYSAARKPGDAPWTAPAFVAATAGESVDVGDLCSADTRVVEGPSTYQRFFSNKAAKSGGDPCNPQLSIPFYSVSTDNDWYGGNPGDTLDIPLTGWSTASMESWPIRPLLGPSGDLINYATARVASSTNVTIAGVTYQTINNGSQATLKVTLPLKAQSGWWNLIHVRSFRLDDAGVTPAGEDFAHRWTIGVYIP